MNINIVSFALTFVQLLVCLALITTILLQSGKSAGLSGSIAGGAETFFGKGKSMDEKLSRITRWLAGSFLVITL
ncbi:MAG: preprotein translocase subunit SecG, partial [Clostridiales bacterium]|nr:preprotein translocase subunit SecG [Clostridiales bacterium]